MILIHDLFLVRNYAFCYTVLIVSTMEMDNIPWHGLLFKLLSFSSSLFRLLEGVWLGRACKVISSQYLDVPEF